MIQTPRDEVLEIAIPGREQDMAENLDRYAAIEEANFQLVSLWQHAGTRKNVVSQRRTTWKACLEETGTAVVLVKEELVRYFARRISVCCCVVSLETSEPLLQRRTRRTVVNAYGGNRADGLTGNSDRAGSTPALGTIQRCVSFRRDAPSLFVRFSPRQRYRDHHGARSPGR